MTPPDTPPARIRDVAFSPLVVGTVQFGLPYGIANRTGQPGFSQVCDIVRCAIENRATTFDTAATYGESEEVLGRALTEIGAQAQATVITKLRHVSRMDAERNAANIQAWIRRSVEDSLRKLRLEQLPLCLFHDTADIEYMEELLRLKEEGLVRHAGVSVTRPDQLETVLATPGVEAVQVAASLLDPRIFRSESMARAARAGIAIFIRSVYLQGLIVMSEDDIHESLRAVIPVRRGLETIASKAGMSLAEMALRYALSLPGGTGILTGVETVAQMEENALMARRGKLPQPLMQEIARAVSSLPDTILFPWHWPGAMR